MLYTTRYTITIHSRTDPYVQDLWSKSVIWLAAVKAFWELFYQACTNNLMVSTAVYLQ